MKKLYRHGDVLIQECDSIPKNAKPKKEHKDVVVEGEITGHAHRMVDPNIATILVNGADMFLDVTQETQIVHEEHDAITLTEGKYKVWIQREYTPEAIRRVID